VGYSFDGGKTIFGFGPTVPENVDSREIIFRLVHGETFPGRVTDDTPVFRSVAENPFHPASMASARQIVYKQDIFLSHKHFRAIKDEHDARSLDQAMPVVRYGFPFPNTVAFNCATYPASLGIQLPHPRGTLSTYVSKLAEMGDTWKPEAGDASGGRAGSVG